MEDPYRATAMQPGDVQFMDNGSKCKVFLQVFSSAAALLWIAGHAALAVTCMKAEDGPAQWSGSRITHCDGSCCRSSPPDRQGALEIRSSMVIGHPIAFDRDKLLSKETLALQSRASNKTKDTSTSKNQALEPFIAWRGKGFVGVDSSAEY